MQVEFLHPGRDTVAAPDGYDWKIRMHFRASFGSVVALLALVEPALADGPLEFGAAVGTGWYEHSNVVPTTTFSARTIRPWIRYDGRAGAWDLDASAHHRMEFFSGRPADSALGGTSRHAIDRVQVHAVRSWEAGQGLTFGGSYIHSWDQFDQDLGATLPDGNVIRWSGLAGTHAGFCEASVRMNGTRYENDPRLVDARSLNWVGRVVPVRRAVDQAFVGATGRQLEVDGSTELVSIRPSVGYRRHVSPAVVVELEAGAALNRFANSDAEALPMVGLGFARHPDRGHALSVETRVRVEGESLAAASAELRYPIASGQLSLGVQSDAEAEGGYYVTANRTTEFAGAVLDTLARANVIGFQGSYVITRPLRGGGSSTDLVRATAWAARRVQPWLNLRIAASYAHEYARSFRPPVRRLRLEAELDFLAGRFGREMLGALTGDRP